MTIVGASLAGLRAAEALRAQGFDGRLVVVGDEAHRPYDRRPLSKDFLAGTVEAEALELESADDDLGASWLLGSTAVGLDASTREVILAGGARVVSDGVVIATGARARTLPGADGLAGVHLLRTIDDAVVLRAALEPGARLVVVGAGLLGCEVAATARTLGLDVTLVEAEESPLVGALGVRMGTVMSDLHEANGVSVRCGVGVQRLAGGDRVQSVELLDGTVLPADVVVVGVGATPNTEWLTGSRIALGDGVECDHQGRTSLPGVVAVGDCASWHDLRLGRAHRVDHWTCAAERPAAAVAALLRGEGTSEPHADDHPVAVPSFWSDQYDVRVQFAGDAAGADSVTVEEGSTDGRDLLAVYRRGGVPVGVLGMNQSRLFWRWRRQLDSAVMA